MDWLKLFALLVAVASIHVTAEGPKKKIRIHLPQKVKHIHHHKKIYITNHPASSQYAPAYMPSAEGAVAVPTNVALPAVTNIVPLNSIEVYDETQGRVPGMLAASSKLLPLYRARGYYGPPPTEWDDQEYDLAPPPEQTEHSYVPTAFSAPSGAAAAPSNHPPKRVKVVKVNEQPRKKVGRKTKPKRVVIRGRPQPEEEHPVSTFHEQFYSDLDGSGTIRKIKKPQRVEKIIDGDTEHIHTYSEEHIHKLVFDDGSTQITSMVGVSPVNGISALSAPHPLMPMKKPQTLLAYPSDALAEFASIGSMGTPSHLEYAAYNPREVTHDHIFHDHGEIPPDMDVVRDPLSIPPKVSYNSQGLRIGGVPKLVKNKYSHKYTKPTKPTGVKDYSYYENMYNPYNRIRNIQKPTNSPPHYGASTEMNVDDYRPLPSFKFKDKGYSKPRNVVPALYFNSGKQVTDYRQQEASVPAPFSVSSTIVHDYKPKPYHGHFTGPAGFTKYQDPLLNFKDNSYSNNFGYDTYASPSAIVYNTNEERNENPSWMYQGKRGKKKSVSTQNINFGGLDHHTTVDHLEDSGISAISMNDGSPTALEHYNEYDQPKIPDYVTSTPFTIKETSPVHPYYSAMAVKALNGDQLSVAEASNNNFQYAEAPNLSTTPFPSSLATTTSQPPERYEVQSTEALVTEPIDYMTDTRQRHRQKDKNFDIHKDHRQKYPTAELNPQSKDFSLPVKPMPTRTILNGPNYSYKNNEESSSTMGTLKYGDKI
ncbi:uncharacterized protein LOC115447994 [Manduca sexta]|uniref:uncharacterized protein LOC115447994 n=1 Tax=Manduca sexta TaxID=7130 RepID=UPI00188E7F84|nr:uncharacterized protein LOC115447994 [Manduca sexta]